MLNVKYIRTGLNSVNINHITTCNHTRPGGTIPHPTHLVAAAAPVISDETAKTHLQMRAPSLCKS